MPRLGLCRQIFAGLDLSRRHFLVCARLILQLFTSLSGTIGHVAHGNVLYKLKTMILIPDVRFKNELEHNITMKLGYANAKIYKAYGSGMEDNPLCDVPGFENCKMKLLRHISFVDCPGHDILMATNGAAIMDGALLLIAANESCPQTTNC
ncbi:hypothetical protein PRUPE_5G215100 [Prunus persica]|uniref:Tr-type G domain-containing protein n=1 Tax=Prunus persica TaxID=3760 RepID=A0A251PBX1_PRUPE|nr:hypothetical protein PRUPE_5G215100 [Prunus persica]